MDWGGDDLGAWLKREDRKSRRRVFWARNRDLVTALALVVAVLAIGLGAGVVAWLRMFGGL